MVRRSVVRRPLYRQMPEKNQEVCCEELHLRHEYMRYHRFFMFSPMFLISTLILAFLASRGELPQESYAFLIGIVILVSVKEVAGVLVSRRIYNQILKPVEELKYGLYEVSRGNYDISLSMGSTPEIAELVQAFNRMSERLKASELEKIKYEENRKALIASISHDLKTPITAINGFIDGILEGIADTKEKQESYLTIVSQNAKYMNRLIDDLLLYAKLDLHKLKFDCIALDFEQYVSELFLELSLENEEKGIRLIYNQTLESPTVVCFDPKHLTRAIRNITANAVSYGSVDHPKIVFDLSQNISKTSVILTITDNGPGIMEEHLEQIFERFFRADDARTNASGSSGLGLAIAKEIVEAHSGSIWVKSALQQGTTIGIEIPIGKEGEACQKREF